MAHVNDMHRRQGLAVELIEALVEHYAPLRLKAFVATDAGEGLCEHLVQRGVDIDVA
ncbi:hypothetical protein ACERK3_11780 [Phycisphaerales bacterium AB-hyl4]|uniref:N-acetyltransferase domain-containing protein n=1 Tax=Natronomicrosphaera hydrolytica TaxID=3242702 RepID=A0ABV4U5T5_9BACT